MGRFNAENASNRGQSWLGVLDSRARAGYYPVVRVPLKERDGAPGPERLQMTLEAAL